MKRYDYEFYSVRLKDLLRRDGYISRKSVGDYFKGLGYDLRPDQIKSAIDRFMQINHLTAKVQEDQTVHYVLEYPLSSEHWARVKWRK